MAQYERLPYKSKDEGSPLKSNFGQLRYKVDQTMNTYNDFATEREVWASITCIDTPPENEKVYSEHVTKAFQKFCIRPWKRRFHEVMISVKDMLMFSKGILMWEGENGCYPESVPMTDVLVDEQAGQFAEDFDTFFQRKRYTAVELYDRVKDPEIASASGWNRNAVLAILRQADSSFKDCSMTDILESFATGAVSSSAQDFTVDVVVALVKEYREHDGKRITKLVFAESNYYPSDDTGTRQFDQHGFLLEKRGYASSMEEAVGLVCHTVSRKFYEDSSFAQLIYTTCKQYDYMMNRIIQAVEDNMRVFLRGGTAERVRKMLSSRMGSFTVMDPDVHIEQERIVRPIADASNVLRQVMIDQNTGIGQYAVGQTDQSGVTKTAKQAEIDLQESTRISSGHLKIFNLFWSYIMCEMYRRFVTAVDENCPEYKNYKRFKAYLASKDIPPIAWKPENVLVESVLTLGAGSPAIKLQNSRIVLEALATPARTPGEQQAKRDMISAAVGVDNADTYLPRDENLRIAEDSLIGLENESLAEPMMNPENIPVHPNHLHLRHIPAHVQEMTRYIEFAEGLVQNIEQFHPDDTGVMLKTIQDILIGVDHIGGHAQAHMQIASESGSKVVKVELQQYAQAIQEVNKRQDRIEQVVAQMQQGRVEEAASKNESNPEFDHKQKMYQMEEEHQANMLALDYRKNVMKAEQLRDQSSQNSAHKENLETQKTLEKIKREQAIDAAKLRKEQASAKTNNSK